VSKSKPIPSVEELRKRYSYDPVTGVLTSLHTGKPITAKHPDGYIYLKFGGQAYLAHRIIWKLITGQEPPDELDHAKGEKANNRWRHLREATPSENVHNGGIRPHNKSRLKGVTTRLRRDGVTPYYEAYICVDGKRIFLGHANSPEEAHRMYCEGADKYYGAFANHG
jgi:HNH endonuclease